jgi:Mpv17 / PMP22 family
MLHRPCVEERSKSSEGSIWSKVSFLFRLVLFVGMLPLIFPESEALVTNLNQRHVAVGHRQRAIPTLSDLLLGGLPQRNWVSLPLRRIPGKSTTSARNVERIRKSYAHEVVSSSSSSSRQNRSSSERQRLGFFPWLLIVASACYICLKYHRWRLTLSVGFLLAHFALQEGIFLDQLSPLRVLRGILAWYMAQLTANPMITKSVSAGLIGTVGDYTAQWLEHILAVRHQARKLHVSALLVRDTCATTTVLPESKWTMDPFWLWPRSITIHGRYDVRRGVSMLADGLFISGPLMHLGYEVFERILPIADTAGSADPASALAAILHVVADSLLLDSFFIASRFFATGLMEGVSLLELVIQFKSIYIPSLQASWATSLILCPIQISCFRYLPLSVRVLSVNCIDVVWDAVLSFMAHRSR